MDIPKNSYLMGKTIHAQSREIIANVYNVCDEEARNNAFKLPLKRKMDRVSLYTGVSQSLVRKIHKEDEKRRIEQPGQMLSSPGRKRSRLSIKDKFDFGDFAIIRRTIQDFYLEQKIVPTTTKLLIKLREIMDFPYSRESLRKLLKANGFYFRKCQNKRKILMEKPTVLHWRYKYIRNIRKYREDGHHIIYIDETWVDNDLTFHKCWQSADVFGIISNIRASGKYLFLNGFYYLKVAFLTIIF